MANCSYHRNYDTWIMNNSINEYLRIRMWQHTFAAEFIKQYRSFEFVSGNFFEIMEEGELYSIAYDYAVEYSLDKSFEDPVEQAYLAFEDFSCK